MRIEATAKITSYTVIIQGNGDGVYEGGYYERGLASMEYLKMLRYFIHEIQSGIEERPIRNPPNNCTGRKKYDMNGTQYGS